MKISKKLFLLLIVSIATLLLIPVCSNAATLTATDETSLTKAIQDAKDGDTISLSNDIVLTTPLEMTDKAVTINGNNRTISSVDTNWTPNGDNSSLLTAGKGATLTLKNITLSNSQKYGVQAYNSGNVILDNVTIKDCKFGGVLVNAGTVEVINLNLGHNGLENSNNGIEIAKGKSLSGSESNPVLKMNGTLTSSEKENVVYVDISDPIANFEVINEDDSPNKIFLNGNQLVITDPNNNILYTGSEVENIDIDATEYVENVTLKVILNEKSKEITLKSGDTISEKDLISKIDLKDLGLSNYKIDGFYSDKDYKTKFDFTNPIDEDTTIYAKLSEKENTPKTGSTNLLEMLALTTAITSMATIIAKRKDFE